MNGIEHVPAFPCPNFGASNENIAVDCNNLDWARVRKNGFINPGNIPPSKRKWLDERLGQAELACERGNSASIDCIEQLSETISLQSMSFDEVYEDIRIEIDPLPSETRNLRHFSSRSDRMNSTASSSV